MARLMKTASQWSREDDPRHAAFFACLADRVARARGESIRGVVFRVQWIFYKELPLSRVGWWGAFFLYTFFFLVFFSVSRLNLSITAEEEGPF